MYLIVCHILVSALTTLAAPRNPFSAKASYSGGAGKSGGDAQQVRVDDHPEGSTEGRPNVVIFLADDLGHADIGYSEGNLQTPTPNIDKLAWDGIILNRHYTNPQCTPSRSAFMTGRDAFRVGMSGLLRDGEPWGLPLQFKIQPQYFKDLGYSTAMFGKWHLGQHMRKFFPGSRGFDYSYWFQGGECNWFNYTSGRPGPEEISGRSLRENGRMVFPNVTNNYYLPEQLISQAERFIHNADRSKPMFLYFATPVPHSGFENQAASLHTMARYSQLPPVRMFSSRFPDRKKQLAMIQALDDQYRRMVDALTNAGVINNTIILFIGDNGAPIPEVNPAQRTNYGSNWPLRLGKTTQFEGGVRTLAYIWSPLLRRRGRITDQLFHMSDWLPTLYEAVGGDPSVMQSNSVTGISQWASFRDGSSTGPRTELVHDINALLNEYAMLYQASYGGLYKIIGGRVLGNNFWGWHRTDGTDETNEMKVWSPTSVKCNYPEGKEVNLCRPHLADCLFNVLDDPCETNNLAKSYGVMLNLLRGKLNAYNTTAFPQQNKEYDPASNPALHEGLWVPWLDPVEVMDAVPMAFTPFAPTSDM